jgi:DNA-binding NarL/FixJ family response regulator
VSTSAHGGPAPPRILVVDDAPAIRAALRGLLEDAGLTVVGEAADGEAGVDMAVRLVPDFVVMDLRMPGIGGLEATGRITAAGGGTRVLVFSAFDGPARERAALAAGASGFLAKGCRPELVIETLRALSGWSG